MNARIEEFHAVLPFTVGGKVVKDAEGSVVLICDEEGDCPAFWSEKRIARDPHFCCTICGRLGQRMVEASPVLGPYYLQPEGWYGLYPPSSGSSNPTALPIGTHFALALADGRYDENRAWKYGRKEKSRPTDPTPDGALFGGQYSMPNPTVLRSPRFGGDKQGPVVLPPDSKNQSERK